MPDVHITIKPGKELTQHEIDQINQAKSREWNEPSMGDEQKKISLFFLLKDSQNHILAQGQLLTINNVIFNHKTFDIYGIGGIIANQKGQGYGKQLMLAIREFLNKEGKSGIGFTGLNIIGFYQKCGFTPDFTSLKCFVHLDKDKKITNTTEDCIFYEDSADKFMQQVLAHPEEEIYLPRDPDW